MLETGAEVPSPGNRQMKAEQRKLPGAVCVAVGTALTGLTVLTGLTADAVDWIDKVA